MDERMGENSNLRNESNATFRGLDDSRGFPDAGPGGRSRSAPVPDEIPARNGEDDPRENFPDSLSGNPRESRKIQKWSADIRVEMEAAWIIRFHLGIADFEPMDEKGFVRLVRTLKDMG